MKPTIIGCGNRERGDDAAGILAADRLRTLGINAELCTGEPTEMMETWSNAQDVIVIDCVVTGAAAGTVHVWDGSHLPAFGRSSRSTHGFGVKEAIELARTLGRLPRRFRIYGIEGKNFEIGGAVSSEVERAVAEVVNKIAAEVGANC